MKVKVKDILAAFMEIGTARNLPDEVVQDALAEAMEKAYQKQTNIKDLKVKTTFENGNLHIYHLRDVVEEVEDEEFEISLEDARKQKPDAKLGDEIPEEVDFHNFERAAIVLAKNVMKQKIREAEKAEVYENYIDRVGDLTFGYVESVEDKFVLVLLGGTPEGKPQTGSTTAMMKHSAQIPQEHYYEGQRLLVVISEVNKESKGALVLVSRADPMFIRRLFEKEVPEIYNGIIEIKAIARDPGMRAKIAVYSHNENIDPIGACIGPRGSRVQAIISELHGEKIDIFEWSDDLQKLVANALSPAQGVIVIPNDEVKDGLIAVVPDNQLSLAIGKKGQNARLAVKLTNHKIDIKSKSDIEAKGIDYMALADKMHEEYEARKAQERAYKQQQRIEELMASAEEDEGIEHVGFTFSEEPDESALHSADTLAARENEEKALEPQTETPTAEESATAETEPAKEAPAAKETPAPAPISREEKKLDEMEEAARLAKEKRKSLADRRAQYASAAPAAAVTPAKPAAKAEEKKEEPKAEEKKPRFEKKKHTFTTMQPIYTEDELKEIEEEELEEELNVSWNEDVDYEEYDEYYDDEY